MLSNWTRFSFFKFLFTNIYRFRNKFGKTKLVIFSNELFIIYILQTTESGTKGEASPPFRITSRTILDDIYEVFAAVNKNTVSILDKRLLVCAMAFSNSKSAGLRKPRNINWAFSSLHKSIVKPEYVINFTIC